MTIQLLKCWPEPFEAVLSGRKKVEVRHDDRGYEVGDLLVLQEWDPATMTYTGRELTRRVSHITRSAGPVRFLDGLVVLSLEDPQGLGDLKAEQARLGALLHDVALALGVPMNYGEVEEERLLDRAVEVRQAADGAAQRLETVACRCDQLAERLVAVRSHVQDAHGTLMLGSAPGAREHIQRAAAELTEVIEGRV